MFRFRFVVREFYNRQNITIAVGLSHHHVKFFRGTGAQNCGNIGPYFPVSWAQPSRNYSVTSLRASLVDTQTLLPTMPSLPTE